MSLQKVATMEQLETLIGQNKSVLLLKNSTTCPISHQAFNEFEKLAQDLQGETFYFLNVQESRELSAEIAEKFSVKHESPQALLFKDGAVTWHASHWNITFNKIRALF